MQPQDSANNEKKTDVKVVTPAENQISQTGIARQAEAMNVQEPQTGKIPRQGLSLKRALSPISAGNTEKIKKARMTKSSEDIKRVIGRRRTVMGEKGNRLVEYLVEYNTGGTKWIECKTGPLNTPQGKVLIRQYTLNVKNNSEDMHLTQKVVPVLLLFPGENQSKYSAIPGGFFIEVTKMATLEAAVQAAPRGKPAKSNPTHSLKTSKLSANTKKVMSNKKATHCLKTKLAPITAKRKPGRKPGQKPSLKPSKGLKAKTIKTENDDFIKYSLSPVKKTVKRKKGKRIEASKKAVNECLEKQMKLDEEILKLTEEFPKSSSTPRTSVSNSPDPEVSFRIQPVPPTRNNVLPPVNTGLTDLELNDQIERPCPNTELPSTPSSCSSASNTSAGSSFKQKFFPQKLSSTRNDHQSQIVKTLTEVNTNNALMRSQRKPTGKHVVIHECDAGITQISMNSQNTQVKNMLNPDVISDLVKALRYAAMDKSTKIVMFSSLGRTFCAGVDIPYLVGEGGKKNERTEVRAKAMANSIKELTIELICYSKPLIACVNGPAVGLGMAILCLCDMVYAKETASFHLPYGRLGQSFEGASSVTFSSMLGDSVTMEMIMTGRELTAMEAKNVGIVSEVILTPLQSIAQAMIQRLKKSISSAQSAAACKQMLREPKKENLLSSLRNECSILQRYWSSEVAIAKMKGYLDEGRHHDY